MTRPGWGASERLSEVAIVEWVVGCKPVAREYYGLKVLFKLVYFRDYFHGKTVAIAALIHQQFIEVPIEFPGPTPEFRYFVYQARTRRGDMLWPHAVIN